MIKLEYPALYNSASRGSANAQNIFLWTIRAEYFLLFLVSVASATRNITNMNPVFIVPVLFVLAGLFVFKVNQKLDQKWYQCRALAESVKTSTWRYVMRAHPFGDASSGDTPKTQLRNILQDILIVNKHIAENLSVATGEQVTETMVEIRGLSVSDRLSYYIKHRIDEQRNWYTNKSIWNKKAQHIWLIITIAIYALTILCLLGNEFGAPWMFYGFDPLIVLVTSALGWLQMKRHGELSASYNLTSHEISLIRGDSEKVQTEDELSEFINEAELGFSREHTQWVARRDAS